ncbi:MAG TPA: S49 family peptidase [Methylibium sp.]|uniref:S49 family peptidase n=1 Tax=Methylibium sp. TaxID=2067992 RepID=UPI002DBAF4C4|nr:S49 family peptidase [Methylibium sp.]HEU4458644.1 S49 family peptidase [Methylibium sp.]
MSSYDPNAPHEPTLGPRGSTAAAPAPLAATAIDTKLIEQFARSYMKERRSDRRWRIFIRLLWLGLFALFVWALFNEQRKGAVPTGPHTALVVVQGEIAGETLASAEAVVAGLRRAFDDAGAQAIVLRINSPGGSPVQAGLVVDEIKRLKTKSPDKKVYAVCEELCASAAYYMAVAADEIYVDKASVVGSIGVLMDGFGFTGTMDKLGIERRLVTAGSNKALLDPFSPLSEADRAYAQTLLEQIHKQFIGVVKEGRGARLKETPDTFSGLFWSGESAVQLGLADALGSVDFVAREVVKAEEIIDYSATENVAERLAKRFGAAVGAGAAKAVGGGFTMR